MQKKTVYLSLGSNLGDRLQILHEAIQRIGDLAGVDLVGRSSFYETDPVGYEEQDLFINLCLEIETTLKPLDLLKALQEIETALHRKRTIRWGPRTLDIDILLYEDFESESEILTLPHPRMTERLFVLIPLEELKGDLMLGKQPIRALIEKLGEQGVRVISDES